MGIRYTEVSIEQALFKIYSRGEQTMKSVAVELNINHHTLKNWMKRKSRIAVGVLIKKERHSQDWNAEQQLSALLEIHALSGKPLQIWCRENCLFTHHFSSGKTAFCTDVKTATGSREIRVLKDEHDRLKRELSRKEHASAEAAASSVWSPKRSWRVHARIAPVRRQPGRFW